MQRVHQAGNVTEIPAGCLPSRRWRATVPRKRDRADHRSQREQRACRLGVVSRFNDGLVDGTDCTLPVIDGLGLRRFRRQATGEPGLGSDQNSFACSHGGLMSLTSIKLIAVAAASSICNRTIGSRGFIRSPRLCPARSGCPQPSQTAGIPRAGSARESGVFSSSSSVRRSRNHNPAWMRRRGSST